MKKIIIEDIKATYEYELLLSALIAYNNYINIGGLYYQEEYMKYNNFFKSYFKKKRLNN